MTTQREREIDEAVRKGLARWDEGFYDRIPELARMILATPRMMLDDSFGPTWFIRQAWREAHPARIDKAIAGFGDGA